MVLVKMWQAMRELCAELQVRVPCFDLWSFECLDILRLWFFASCALWCWRALRWRSITLSGRLFFERWHYLSSFAWWLWRRGSVRRWLSSLSCRCATAEWLHLSKRSWCLRCTRIVRRIERYVSRFAIIYFILISFYFHFISFHSHFILISFHFISIYYSIFLNSLLYIELHHLIQYFLLKYLYHL